MMTFPKRIVAAAMLGCGLLAGTALAQPATVKIGTVDMQKVFDKYYKWQQDKQALAKEKANLEKDLDDFAKSITKEQDDYKKLRQQADDPMITDEAKKLRQKAVDDKASAIQTDEQSYRDLANQGQQKLERYVQTFTDAILQDIQAAVKAKAKAAGFTLVLNTTSDALQSNSPVVYSNGDNDITDEIIKQLNAGAPDTMPTPDSAKGTTNSDTKKK